MSSLARLASDMDMEKQERTGPEKGQAQTIVYDNSSSSSSSSSNSDEGASSSSHDGDGEVQQRPNYESYVTEDPDLLGEMKELERSFKNLSDDYLLVDKIGEGTFSSVYKAIDLHYQDHENEWDTIYNEDQSPRSVQFVAMKRIYVTASPRRILNELKLLRKLSGSTYIAPIITALRHQDQILVVLPYFAHTEFRYYYRYMTMTGIRRYMRDMLSGLEFIHSKRIMHRDIKPANFLFDCSRGYGVIVDFGLAEAESDLTTCPCTNGGLKKRNLSIASQGGYRKEDRRPGRHANRAGTRGFRAPEVLYRCNSQTTKIDMWSVGVVLLSILTRRVPFFNSADDEDALIELATIWGKQQVNACAFLHGLVFETTVPTIPDVAYALEDIVGCFSGRPTAKNSDDFSYTEEEEKLLDLLKGLLELNFRKRLSASQALNHAFFDQAIDPEEPLVNKQLYKRRDKGRDTDDKKKEARRGKGDEGGKDASKEDLQDGNDANNDTEPIQGEDQLENEEYENLDREIPASHRDIPLHESDGADDEIFDPDHQAQQPTTTTTNENAMDDTEFYQVTTKRPWFNVHTPQALNNPGVFDGPVAHNNEGLMATTSAKRLKQYFVKRERLPQSIAFRNPEEPANPRSPSPGMVFNGPDETNGRTPSSVTDATSQSWYKINMTGPGSCVAVPSLAPRNSESDSDDRSTDVSRISSFTSGPPTPTRENETVLTATPVKRPPLKFIHYDRDSFFSSHSLVQN